MTTAAALPAREETPTIGRGGAGRYAFVGQRRVAMVLPLCLEMVDAVRCADKDRIQDLAELIDQPAALVVLAAMVDQDSNAATLLAWTDDLVSPRQLVLLKGAPQPCGTHAAFNRHKGNGQQPCAVCVEGERLYQRDRQRRRRAARALS